MLKKQKAGFKQGFDNVSFHIFSTKLLLMADLRLRYGYQRFGILSEVGQLFVKYLPLYLDDHCMKSYLKILAFRRSQ